MFIFLDEETFGEDSEQGDFNVSSLMTSSNDIYLSNSNYNFSAVRFKVRGYDNRYSDVFINGINFNDAERGGFSYGMIGGLNDATRNQDVINATSPSRFNFGQIGGSSNISTWASGYSPGSKVGVAYTNRNYKLRGTAMYSTGVMDNGWALSGMLAYRWADQGFIKGTFYNSLGAFFSAEKILNDKNNLSFTFFVAPTQRGQASATTEEIADLLDDHYYNSNWGYQNGKVRNSRIVTTWEPTFIASHLWKISNNTQLQTGIGTKYKRYGSTAIEYASANNPRPDYYKNLPSYHTGEAREKAQQDWLNDINYRQVNWDGIYDQNRTPQAKKNGGVYTLGERMNNQLNATLNSTLTTKLNRNITMMAGVEARYTKGMHYETIADLLGASYFLNENSFARTDIKLADNPYAAFYDLNNPNTKAVKGDRIRYDYDIHVRDANVWVQNEHRYAKWDVYYGFKFGYNDFYRYGNMRNGLALDNSYGKGKLHSFVEQSTKFGLTYKLSGRHMFSGNVSYSILPPLADNAYISSRVKDDAVADLKDEKVFSANVNYTIATPVVKGRVTAFQTNFYDQAELYHYFDDGNHTFSNLSLSGINKIHRGVELGLEAAVTSALKLSFIGTMAEYFYNNRPTGTWSSENGAFPDRTDTYYLKNFYESGTPQTAGSFGVHYFYNYWFFDATFNAFDRTYIDISPIRRREDALGELLSHLIDEARNEIPPRDEVTLKEVEAKVDEIIPQEKFAGGYTIDFSIGKSLILKRKYRLNINMQFNNILNNINLKTNGYEYARFDFATQAVKVPSFYYYAQGFNCFLTANFRF
ncbi:MAG: TonB-dependent receptor [Dysgonamonadaceae bacterium]|nr:TonB-dependent receptor [Dysgonamonadaceae bacterium]